MYTLMRRRDAIPAYGAGAARGNGMEETKIGKNDGAILRTVGATAAALSGVPALLFAYRLVDRFDAEVLLPSVLLIFCVPVLFTAFYLIQGFAAGLVASTLEKRPLSILPHLGAPVAFGAALLLSYAILGRWAVPEALLAVAFYPAGFLLFRARSKKRAKTSCVLNAVIPTVVLSVLIFFLRAITAKGFSADAPAQYFAGLETMLKTAGRNLAEWYRLLAGDGAGRLLQTVTNASILDTHTVEEGYALLGEEYAKGLAGILRILPAAAIGLMNVAGFLSASMCNRTSPFFRDRSEWRLSVSGVGTLLFLFSMAASLFFSVYDESFFAVFVYSFRLIFLPVFLGIGAGVIFSLKKEQLSGHILLAVICGILIVLRPLIAIPMIGVYGNAVRRISERRTSDRDGPPEE